jgi:glyceraldehyde 3-phosphate dehydrogenase
MIRIAINGFGRIGRTTFKAGWGVKGVEFVAVNDLTDPKTLAYLLKHDTIYHDWPHKVSAAKDSLVVDGKKVLAFAERDPKVLPWKKLKIDIVLECTGVFRTKELAGQHLTAGAKKVIISAPSKGEGVNTYLLGVNAEKYKGENIIDNGSCTTNCIAPIAAIVEEKWGIKKAWMTTTHAYTADQSLVDGPHKDLRRGRTAGQNIVPTTTGAAVTAGKVIPSISGKFDGMSVRVPIAVISLADFTFFLKKSATDKEVNAHFKKITKLPKYKGIVGATEEQLVSSDFIGNSYSGIVDLNLTKVIDGDLLKIIAWYDNEWGYSCRLIEIARFICTKIKNKR